VSNVRDSGPQPGANGLLRLAAHVRECEECGREAPPVESIVAVLRASALPVDPRELSGRVLARLQPHMEQLATRAFWRRVAVVLVASILPLPVVLAYDAYLLRLLYAAASSLLPEAVAAYLVLSYAALLALLFAGTYAAVPLLLAPPLPRQLAPQE